MKNNSTFTSVLTLIIAILLFTITSMLLTSCSGVRYAYFDKKKVPYTAPEETKFAKTVRAKPFLSQPENQPEEKASPAQDRNNKQKNVGDDTDRKKTAAPAAPRQVSKEVNIEKYIPKQHKGTQSETEMDRDLAILILIVAIILVIALLGQDLVWLLFVALLIILIYVLIKYLGVFN